MAPHINFLIDLINNEEALEVITKAFDGAFLSDFILIYAFLRNQAVTHQSKSLLGRFWKTDEASKLLNTFDKCKSFEEIHDCLLDYVKANPDTPFTDKLMQCASHQAFYNDFVLRR